MTHSEQTSSLPPFDPAYAERIRVAAGLKKLNPVWAKLEIVLGLSAAVFGLVLLRDRAVHDLIAGPLIVCGAYLAMAGNRSHLYQSQNRQTGYLVQCARART